MSPLRIVGSSPLFFSSLLVLLSCNTTRSDLLYSTCPTGFGNYTANSTFESNLRLLLSSMTQSTPKSGFFYDAKGEVPDKIHGLALCRGDITSQECSDCVATASHRLPQLCPYDKAATAWYDWCLVGYGITDLRGSDLSSTVLLSNNTSVSDPELFDRQLVKMMNAISQIAAFNTSAKMFATGRVDVTSSTQVYGMAQCTRELSGDECRQCLSSSLGVLQQTCYGLAEAMSLFGENCILRYQEDKFFESAPLWTSSTSADGPTSSPPPIFPPPSGTATTSKGSRRRSGARTYAAIVIPVAVIIILACTFCIVLKRRKTSKKRLYNKKIQTDTRLGYLVFDFSALQVATGSFSNTNKLGEGGFGAVYKGRLSDGQEIAVKRVASSEQGLVQLRNEVQVLAKLQHKNLVRLLGVCLQKQDTMLVYEYIKNKSLDNFLFDPASSKRINWEQRHKIILGIARGLLYLHEDSSIRLIHRDLKASNILLDDNLNPKISDFGLARLLRANHTQSRTATIVGTYGYMAPEYALNGNVSTKTDIYSLGVLILEILTGRENTSFCDSTCAANLLSYAWICWANGKTMELIDPSLGENYPTNEVARCIHIRLLCVQENPSDRPEISSVTLMLTRRRMSLQPPLKPAFFFGDDSEASPTIGQPSQSQETISSAERTPVQFSLNEMSNTEPCPR